jgi:hypothetical protein
MDLVLQLINEPEKRLDTLKEVRSRILGNTETVMIANMKKLLIALK